MVICLAALGNSCNTHVVELPLAFVVQALLASLSSYLCFFRSFALSFLREVELEFHVLGPLPLH